MFLQFFEELSTESKPEKVDEAAGKDNQTKQVINWNTKQCNYVWWREGIVSMTTRHMFYFFCDEENALFFNLDEPFSIPSVIVSLSAV